MSETFDQWWKKSKWTKGEKHLWTDFSMSIEAWHHQQKKIAERDAKILELEKSTFINERFVLQKANEALEFSVSEKKAHIKKLQLELDALYKTTERAL